MEADAGRTGAGWSSGHYKARAPSGCAGIALGRSGWIRPRRPKHGIPDSLVVAPGEASPSAQDKARRKPIASGEPVHSFRTLLDDLATIAKNRIAAPLANAEPFDLITRPTALQRQAFKRLGIRLERAR